MGEMFPQCDTTLSVYESNSIKVLCRIKVLPPGGNNSHTNGDTHLNTCGSMSAEQRSAFDRELQLWLELKGSDNYTTEECLRQFIVKPNLHVKIRRSNLTIKEFLKCYTIDNGDCGAELNGGKCSQVLDCLLEYKSLLPIVTLPATEEYEPAPTTSKYNNDSVSPLSYEPYTPSKRKRRFHSEYKIRTPGLDLLGFESAEDTYSPKPITSISTPTEIVNYNPAPIRDRFASLDSQSSAKNEVIVQAKDERLPYEKYKSINVTLKSKVKKCRAYEEYVPQTQLVTTDIPAYNPTPIESRTKRGKDKVFKEKEKNNKASDVGPEIQKDKMKCVTYDRPRDTIAKDKTEKLLSESSPVTLKEAKPKSSRSPTTSDNERDRSSRKYAQHRDRKKKEIYKSKEIVNELGYNGKCNEDQGVMKINRSNYIESNESVLKTAIDKQREQDKGHRKKGQRKRKEYEDSVKILPSISTETKKSITKSEKEIKNMASAEKVSKNVGLLLSSIQSTRRSERAPSKNKRYLEDHEVYGIRKKSRTIKTSPKNKELFGSDDDDNDNVGDASKNYPVCPILKRSFLSTLDR